MKSMDANLEVPAGIAIIPAILPHTFDDLQATVEAVHTVAQLVQIDIVDGIFAPQKTWPYTDESEFKKIVAQDEGLPYWEDVDFQFDLMVAHPKEEVMQFVQAGAASVVLHVAAPGVHEALAVLQESRPLVSVGLALLPHTSPEDLISFEGSYDFVQVMGVAQVGAQGHPFDDRALELVASLHAAQPLLPIQVDGGVSISNASALIQAGASRLVVGSAIFGAQDPVAAYKMLYSKAND